MNRLTIVGLVIVAVLVIVAIFAPWIATHDVGATNPSLRFLPPSSQYFFGTDSTGRDIFSRVVFGARISLKVGIVVVTVSAIVGTLLGALAGFYGRGGENIVNRYTFAQVVCLSVVVPGLLRG